MLIAAVSAINPILQMFKTSAELPWRLTMRCVNGHESIMIMGFIGRHQPCGKLLSLIIISIYIYIYIASTITNHEKEF